MPDALPHQLSDAVRLGLHPDMRGDLRGELSPGGVPHNAANGVSGVSDPVGILSERLVSFAGMRRRTGQSR